MKRFLAAAAAVSAVGLPVASVSLAPAADAVTNPAQNPHPITVKGDDGETYTDGADTLPGFDDEACTYIPGAWFDFDNNRVHYADGQSIPWTEWDRATGYAEWKAKRDKPTQTASARPTSKPTAKPTTKTTAKPTTKSSPAGGGTGHGTRTPTHQPTPTTSASAGVTSTPSAAATTSATAAPTDTPSEAVTTPAPVTTTAASSAAAVPVGDPSPSVGTTDAQVTEVAAESSGSSVPGFLIIGGLVGAAAVLLAGNAVYRRSRKESVQ